MRISTLPKWHTAWAQLMRTIIFLWTARVKIVIKPFGISKGFLSLLIFIGAKLQVYSAPQPPLPALTHIHPAFGVWVTVWKTSFFTPVLYFGRAVSEFLSPVVPVISGTDKENSGMPQWLYFLPTEWLSWSFLLFIWLGKSLRGLEASQALAPDQNIL